MRLPQVYAPTVESPLHFNGAPREIEFPTRWFVGALQAPGVNSNQSLAALAPNRIQLVQDALLSQQIWERRNIGNKKLFGAGRACPLTMVPPHAMKLPRSAVATSPARIGSPPGRSSHPGAQAITLHDANPGFLPSYGGERGNRAMLPLRSLLIRATFAAALRRLSRSESSMPTTCLAALELRFGNFLQGR